MPMVLDENDMSRCYPDNPTPTIVSSIFLIVSLIAAACVCIAGTVDGYEKAKEKKLAKMIKQGNVKRAIENDRIDREDTTTAKVTLRDTKIEKKKEDVSSGSLAVKLFGDDDIIGDNYVQLETNQEKESTQHINEDKEQEKQEMDKENDKDKNTAANTGNENEDEKDEKDNETKEQDKDIKDIEDIEKQIDELGDSIDELCESLYAISNFEYKNDANDIMIDIILGGDDDMDINFCDKKFLWYFIKFTIKDSWDKKRCYMPFVTHIIDQATDIAVIIRFYQMYNFESKYNFDCPKINGGYLFWLSICAFCFYRIVSCIWVYKVTSGKTIDTIGQVFDLKLYHAMYINFVLRKPVPSNPQRYLQILEASLESFPQCVIQLYYLIQVGSKNYGDENTNILIVVSLIFSIVNITSKMISEDKVFLPKSWHSLDFAAKPFSVNPRYLFRCGLRLVDFIQRLLLILLTWVTLGGPTVFAYLCFEFMGLFIISAQLKELSVLIWIAQTPFQIPLKWTHEKISNKIHNKLQTYICLNGFFVCCCCGAFCGVESKYIGRWMAVMSRFIISLILSGIILNVQENIDDRHISNDGIEAMGIVLIILTLIVPWCFSFINSEVVTDHRMVTMDRNANTLAMSGTLNEIEDLKLFGMNVDGIFNKLIAESEIKSSKSKSISKSKSGLNSNNEAPVFYAARFGDVETMAQLLKQGATVNVTNKDGDTPLIVAAKENHIHLVGFMLCQDPPICNVNECNINNGRTSLMATSSINTMLMLLNPRFTIDVNITDNNGMTALMIAARDQAELQVQVLLRYHKKMRLDINSQDDNGFTAVTHAVSRGHVDILRLLKTYKADFRVTTKIGDTLLMVAAEYDEVESMKFLVNENPSICDINERNNKNGFTALMKACLSNESLNAHHKIMAAIMQHQQNGGRFKPISFSAIGLERSTKAAKWLLTQPGIDIDCVDNCGQTAAMIAAQTGAVEVLKVLKEHNAVFDKKMIHNENKDWTSILGLACMKGHFNVAKFLIESFDCCDWNETVDNFGNKPIMLAAQGNSVELIEYIIGKSKCDGDSHSNGDGKEDKEMETKELDEKKDNKKDTNEQHYHDDEKTSSNSIVHGMNDYGETPFFYAGSGNAVDSMKFLLNNYKININMKDVNGWTTFMFAASNGSINVLEYLVNNYHHIVDMNASNKDGKTALDLAIEKKHEECIQFLSKKGAFSTESLNADSIEVDV